MVLPAVPLYSGHEKPYFFPVFLCFVKKRGCFKAREEFWNRLKGEKKTYLTYSTFVLKNSVRPVARTHGLSDTSL
jgi:hypothetical protein